jgi:hypothetical protein
VLDELAVVVEAEDVKMSMPVQSLSPGLSWWQCSTTWFLSVISLLPHLR